MTTPQTIAKLFGSQTETQIAEQLRAAFSQGSINNHNVDDVVTDRDGFTSSLLLISAKWVMPEVVSILCQNGANIARMCSEGLAINLAVKSAFPRNESQVVILIKTLFAYNNNSPIDHQSPVTPSALFTACSRGLLKIATCLTNDTSSMIYTGFGEYPSPLAVAASVGHFEICSLLLRKGLFPVDGPDKTPLMFACEGGHVAIIQLLMDHGADINKTDFLCNNALHFAASSNCAGCLNFVLNQVGTSMLNCLNSLGERPVDVAIRRGSAECCEILIRDNVVFSDHSLRAIASRKDLTLLKKFIAARQGNMELSEVRILVEADFFEGVHQVLFADPKRFSMISEFNVVQLLGIAKSERVAVLLRAARETARHQL